MSLSLTEEIKRTFELATLRREALSNLSAQDWQEYQRIQSRYEGERRSAERVYRSEYTMRVERARADLLHRAGRKDANLTARFGRHDRFDKSALERQAHRHVQNEHLALMSKLDERERDDIRSLVEGARRNRSGDPGGPDKSPLGPLDPLGGPKRPRLR